MKPNKVTNQRVHVNLDRLLVDLSNKDDLEIEELARKLYRDIYITSRGYGIHKTHDGEEVKFWESRFGHAFYKPKDWQTSGVKAVVDRPRIERLKWIGEVIKGTVPNSACWLLRQNLTKRLYTVVPKGYVVWLEYTGENLWTFSSGYVTTPQQIHKYTRGEKLIWKFGQNKAP